MFARNNKVKQITEAVQFESERSNVRGQFGVGVNLPLIAFLTPEQGWTISSKLGEVRRGFVTKTGDNFSPSKKVYKKGDTICEETIKSDVSPRGMVDLVDACHDGRCEFESRSSRRTGVIANFSF